MSRYSSIKQIKTDGGERMYKNIKYPEIPLSNDDFYITTVRGDRYDNLALQFYEDKSLWWVISLGNAHYTQNTLYPPIGKLIRVPINVSTIISQYEALNN